MTELDKIISKLDKIDSRLDSIVKETENRVTKLEEKVEGLTGSIKVGLAFILSTVSAVFIYMFKTVFVK